MSEIGAAHDHDTHLMPVLFRDGSDRRRSARIPLATPVKIGPPNGTPYAPVSASDLSKNGLFIDADRPVRVGARFSAEIQLTDVKIYIPEAEVAYNRDRQTGSGFGVRFVNVDPGALAAVADEIDRVTDQTMIVRGKKGWSDLPTLPPADSALGIELSTYPEPEIVDEALESAIGSRAFASEPPAVDKMQVGLRETRQRFLERARSAPSVFRILAIAGSLGLVASAAFALAQGNDGDAIAPQYDPTEHGVAATTHQVLMGKKEVEALDKPAPFEPSSIDDPKLRRKLLPPLVVLEEEQIQGKVDPPKVEKKIEKKIEPAKKIEKPKAKSGAIRIEGIDPGAKILKTHVFHSPDRFVIDLAGQSSALSLPANARSGRHPDFFRVVVDAKALEAGRATVEGRALVVELSVR